MFANGVAVWAWRQGNKFFCSSQHWHHVGNIPTGNMGHLTLWCTLLVPVPIFLPTCLNQPLLFCDCHPPPLTQTLRIQYTMTMWQTTPICNRKIGRSLSVCLVTLNLHPRPTTTYVALHSDDCYFGIMSICTVLNWSAVKSRLNTVLSYHAILANVSLAECVQIWSRVMEMSGGQCSLFSRLVSLRFSILFLPTLL